MRHRCLPLGAVAGGEYFKESTVVMEIKKKLRIGTVGLLHNPANAAGIRAFKELLQILPVLSVLIIHSHKHAREGFIATTRIKYYTDNKVSVTGGSRDKLLVCRRRSSETFGPP